MSELPSYEEALDRIRPHWLGPRVKETLAPSEAVGRVLCLQVTASEPYPRFDNSAVDGYAVGSEVDARVGAQLTAGGVVGAGDAPPSSIAPGSAVRLLTGAPTPNGTWGVAMQEDVDVEQGRIVLRTGCAHGAHIRRRGDDYEAGTPLLAEGDVVNPGAIALLAEQGVAAVEVWARPRVGILTTGAELVDPSESPPPGCLRDSNGTMLRALATAFGGDPVAVRRCGDTVDETREALEALAATCDLVVTAGGVSVGDRDCVPAAVKSLGEVLVHGVGLKPGKPLLAGKIGSCAIFGLPGNPASAFVGFHLFVREALNIASGRPSPKLPWFQLPFFADRSAQGRDEFVRCEWTVIDGVRGTRPVGGQGSFGLRSLAAADCLVWLARNQSVAEGGVHPTLMLG